jgi:hypothetical protein
MLMMVEEERKSEEKGDGLDREERKSSCQSFELIGKVQRKRGRAAGRGERERERKLLRFLYF